MSESRVTWATSVPILVFLGLSVLELGPTYATDRRQTDRRQTDKRQTWAWRHINPVMKTDHQYIILYSRLTRPSATNIVQS